MLGLAYLLSINNLEQTKLAEILGIKKQNVNAWIRGKQKIPIKYLPILADLLGVEQDLLSKELSVTEKTNLQISYLLKEKSPNPLLMNDYEVEQLDDAREFLEKKEVIERIEEGKLSPFFSDYIDELMTIEERDIHLLQRFNKLNEKGQERLLEYLYELQKISEYVQGDQYGF